MGCCRSLRVLRACAAAALVSACGGDAIGRSTPVDGTSPPTVVDGGGGTPTGSDGGSADGGAKQTRLKVSAFEDPALSVWDALKQVICQPTVAADGVERCLPSGSNVYFTKAYCTDPVIVKTPDSCGVTSAYFVDAQKTCDGRTTVYTPGAPIDPPASLFGGDGEFCAQAPGPVPGPTYEAVPSDPTEWVELTPDVVPVTATLAVASWKGADGSVIPDGLRLLPSGARCDLYSLEGPPTYCLPTLRAESSDALADDRCTSTRLVSSHCAPTDVVDVGSQFDSTGQLSNGLFETGSVVSPVFTSNVFTHDVCTLLAPTPGDPFYYYTIGAPLRLDRYPVLSTSIEGSGRIQTQYWTSAGKNLFALGLYDSQYGEGCTAMQLAGGGTWCVPAVVYVGQLSAFSDSQCTVPVGFDSPSKTHPTWALVTTQNQCGSSAPPALYTTVPYQGPVYITGFPDAQAPCVPFSGPAGAKAVKLGAPLDPSQVLAPVPPVR